jgi:uncharacterized membrane protein
MTVDEALKYVISMGVVAPRRTPVSGRNATERVAPVATLGK